MGGFVHEHRRTTPPALDLAVIDYGMGNLRSVLRAFERVGASPGWSPRLPKPPVPMPSFSPAKDPLWIG